MSKKDFHSPARRKCDSKQQSQVLLSFHNHSIIQEKVWEIRTIKAIRKITYYIHIEKWKKR